MKNLTIKISLLMLSGCGMIAHGPTQDILVTSNPPSAIVTTTTYAKDSTEQIKRAIVNKRLIIGMNKNEVLAVMGKLPEDINRTIGICGIHEQYVYNRRVSANYIYSPIYLYFEDGLLTSWQE